MYGRIPTQVHPHETSRKTSAKPWVAWSEVSRFGTTCIRVLDVYTRTKMNRSNVSTMAKFMRVGSRLAKSRFEKHLHASIVASHVVNRAQDASCPQSLT